MILKKRWVVRATLQIGGAADWYQGYEEFKTREKARGYARLLRELGNWKEIKIFRATEVVADNGVTNIYLVSRR